LIALDAVRGLYHTKSFPLKTLKTTGEMVKNIMLPLRGAQAIFTIVVLGLTAYGQSSLGGSRLFSQIRAPHTVLY
jgi:hypothetical protein